MNRRGRRLWNRLTRYRYEVCHECGRRVGDCTGAWWHADDELWIEVVEPAAIEEGVYRRVGSGILCPPCFTRKARAKGIHVFWHARVDWRDGEDIEEAARRSGLRGPTPGQEALAALLAALDRGRVVLPNGALLLEVEAEWNDGMLYRSQAAMLLDQDDLADLRSLL